MPAEIRGNLPGKSIGSKKEDKATLYSLSEQWILPAASTINTEEREFVVDSGVSMHMVSMKDLNKAELETEDIEKSDNGSDSQRRSANKRRSNSIRLRIGVTVPPKTPSESIPAARKIEFESRK